MLQKKTLDLRSLWRDLNLGTGCLQATQTSHCPSWTKEDGGNLVEESTITIYPSDKRIWVQIRLPQPLYWASQSIYGPLSHTGYAPYWNYDPKIHCKFSDPEMFGNPPFCPPAFAFIEDAIKVKGAPSLYWPIVDYGRSGQIVNAGLFSNFPAGKREEESVKQTRLKEFRKVAQKQHSEHYLLNFCSEDYFWPSFFEESIHEGLGPFHELQYVLMAGVGLVENKEEYCAVVEPSGRDEGVIPSYPCP